MAHADQSEDPIMWHLRPLEQKPWSHLAGQDSARFAICSVPSALDNLCEVAVALIGEALLMAIPCSPSVGVEAGPVMVGCSVNKLFENGGKMDQRGKRCKYPLHHSFFKLLHRFAKMQLTYIGCLCMSLVTYFVLSLIQVCCKS